MNGTKTEIEDVLRRIEGLARTDEALFHAAKESLRVFQALDHEAQTQAAATLRRVLTAGLTTWAASLYQ